MNLVHGHWLAAGTISGGWAVEELEKVSDPGLSCFLTLPHWTGHSSLSLVSPPTASLIKTYTTQYVSYIFMSLLFLTF